MAQGVEHVPTKENRDKVTAMAIAGCAHPLIAKVIGISRNTLRKHYREELATAEGTLYGLAGAALVRNLKLGNQRAVELVLKRNPEWRENLNVHHTGEGAPVSSVRITLVKPDGTEETETRKDGK